MPGARTTSGEEGEEAWDDMAKREQCAGRNGERDCGGGDATTVCEIGSGPETTARGLCAESSTVRIERDANACGEGEDED